MTKTFRIYGPDGHRMRFSFEPSQWYIWENADACLVLEVRCADKTGTNDYVEVVVDTTERSPELELMAQIEDGLFEGMRTGEIVELIDGQEYTFAYPY